MKVIVDTSVWSLALRRNTQEKGKDMSNIQWKIIKNSENKNDSIDLEIYDENLYPLSWFFFAASTSDYFDIIEEAIQGIGYGLDASGITFPGDLDGYDLTQREPIPPDMVEVYVLYPDCKIQIPQSTFFQILLEGGEYLLSVRRELGKASKKWEEKMEKALAALRLKVEQINKDKS